MKLLSHLSRVITPGRTFIPQIDGLRFIAIMAVIAFHVRAICSFHFGVSLESAVGSEGIVNRTFESGAGGVELFFAISGFILALPFAKHYLTGAAPVSLRAYYLRRLTRLEPPYIIQLVVLFVLCWVVFRRFPSHPNLYHNDAWLSYAGEHIGASLFYVNGFIFGKHPYPNIVLWSLEIEVQFYILAPFLVRIFKVSNVWVRRLCIAGVMLGVTLVFHAFPAPYWLGNSLAGNIPFFLAGFLLCDFYLTDWAGRPKGQHAWDGLFLLSVGAVLLLHNYTVLGIIFPWVILICCAAAFRGIYCSKLLSQPWIVVIGGMCYTIYMYHWLMISTLIRMTVRLQTHVFWLDLIIQFVLMSILIIAACGVLFVLFERPFMQRDWPAKLWAKMRPCPKPAPTPGAL